MRNWAGFWILVLPFGACAPYGFQGEVEEFAKSVNEAVLGLNRLTGAVAEDIIAKDRAELYAQPLVIGIHEDCLAGVAQLAGQTDLAKVRDLAQAASSNCDFLLVSDPGGPDQERLNAALENRSASTVFRDRLGGTANIFLLADALADYAHALELIVSAANPDQLDRALIDTKGSIDRLACRIDENDGCKGDEGGLTGALTSLVTAGLSSRVDALKFRALKSAVANAHDDVVAATGILQDVQAVSIGIIAQNRAAALSEAPLLVIDAQTAEDRAVAHQDLIAARDRYLDSLRIGGKDIFGQMRNAHRQLKVAIESPKRQIDELRDTLQEFAKDAKDIAQLFDGRTNRGDRL